ncbi:hypothetical protein LMJF_17_0610 [Leishmania major strain Friedlin]|uniref:ACB domain-containing protein n=1 Tax=Leishmania major TaxID=5664 RepID=Q4QED3_LEIMA|nr:hypothetical protein LMJF_17_0610 [Leishmania major strain Friedlin]CAG9572286.1 Acyl_CoA_binding_protein_-_putative [Leishmania major strain Friedlin]CAJ03592.1 hypothetical protein LMJF_17_0610 [Leishmania major strain Friedlin]|eukprot:XP_001682315.1 hypothetical protein LMJF_17_0610 [Leishmania major strain Friedlin]
MLATFFGRRAEPEFKVVCDPESIVFPVDFDAPDYPYEQAFEEADAYVRKLPTRGVVPVSDVLRLQFYSLFKQATEGDINEDVKQPSMLRDWEGYWKVYGWRKCRGMTRERARDLYTDLLDLQIRKHCSFVWGAPSGEDRWAAFYDGVRIIRNLPKGGYYLPDSLRAHFYALYKQALVGNLSDFQKTPAAFSEKYKWLRSRPSKAGFDQMRYDEWAALKGMSCEKAKRMYCKDIFKSAAMCGYVWAPPGTADHLKVIGDQTSAKTLKKRTDADEHAERIAGATHLTMEEAMDAVGVHLSMVERLTMHSFTKKEQTAAARTAEEAAGRKKREEKAEVKRRGVAGSHVDLNKGMAFARPKAEESTEATVTEKTEETEAKEDAERRLEAQGTDKDPQSVCNLCGSFAKDIASDAEAPEKVKESGAAAAAAKDCTAASTSPAPVPKLQASAKVAEASKILPSKSEPVLKKEPAVKGTSKGAKSSHQAKNGAKKGPAGKRTKAN